jgi:hypothetical protein
METLETLLVALAFTAVYAFSGRLLPVQLKFPRRWLSLAAGVSVAYVFVDILPELEARRQGLVGAMGGTPLFAAQRIYIAALAGFVFFYGLDLFLLRSRLPSKTSGKEGSADAVFWLHIGGYALYSWMITYLLVDRAAKGERFLALYGLAMVLHMTGLSSALLREHGRAYNRFGWWVLAASVLAGWLMSVTVRMPEIAIDRLFAFIGGGVVMTSMNEELPREREGRFPWFLLGTSVYAILLILAA